MARLYIAEERYIVVGVEGGSREGVQGGAEEGVVKEGGAVIVKPEVA